MQPSGPAGGRRPLRSGVYQTGDGTQWTYVGVTTEVRRYVAAVSATVAAVEDHDGPDLAVRVTTDGGRTWQSYPTTMP